MKKYTVISALLCSILLCGCSSQISEQSYNESPATDITDSSEKEAENSSEAESSQESTESSSQPEQTEQTSGSVAEEKPLIENGIFTLPDGSLSFATEQIPEGEELTESSWMVEKTEIGYVFSSENTSNSYTLNVSKPGAPIAEITGEEMTELYSSRMENFKLHEFYTLELSGCPVAYCQFSGMVSQVKRESTITILIIQSETAEYQITFNQTVFDYTFQGVIDNVVATLKVN